MIHKSINKEKGLKLIIFGAVIALVYKAYKVFLKGPYNLDPYTDYFEYEGYLTLYRIAASILGILIINRFYMPIKQQFSFSPHRTLKLFSLFFLIIFIFIRIFFYKIYFLPHLFFKEVYFNFFVGIWEEYIFRGLILFSLLSYTNKWWALIISSLCFSLWHYDGGSFEISRYYFLFIMGLIFGSYFLIAKRFLEVCFLHFLWDLIFFGMKTDIVLRGAGYYTYYFTLCAFVTLASLIIISMIDKKSLS